MAKFTKYIFYTSLINLIVAIALIFTVDTSKSFGITQYIGFSIFSFFIIGMMWLFSHSMGGDKRGDDDGGEKSPDTGPYGSYNPPSNGPF